MRRHIAHLRAFTTPLALFVFLAGCGHERTRAHPTTVSLQGGPLPTCADELIHGFYDVTVRAFAKGAEHVDVAQYEMDSFEFFRKVAARKGIDPKLLIDHVAGIPRQMVQIAKDDPSTLEKCENFSLALTGPP